MSEIAEHKYIIAVVFCLALIVSVVFNTFVIGIEHEEADGLMYSAQAKHLSDYLFKTADARYPLFPVFLSALYAICGDWLFGIRFIISLLGAVNCVLVYLIAKHTSGKTVAALAGLACAVYPNLFFWSAFLGTETLFTTLLLAAVCFLVRLNEQTSVGKLILIGLFLGLATLTRGMLLFFFPLLLVWLVYFTWSSKKMLRTLSWVFITVAIIIAPWTMRNYIVLKSFVPIAANGGRALYGANNPLSLTRQMKGYWDDGAVEKNLPETKQMTIVQTDRYCYSKALEWSLYTVKTRPFDFLQLEFWKLQKAFFPRLWSRTSCAKIAFAFAYFFVSVFGIIGTIISFRDAEKYSLFYCILLTHLFVTLLFFGEMRQRAPFDPFLLIFTALCINKICLYLAAASPREAQIQNSILSGVSGK